MNKRIVSLIMAFVLIYNFTGCQKKEKNFNETLRVGVVTYTQDDPFINAMTQELKDNLKSMENDNFRIIVSEKNGDDSQRDQDEVVEEMIDAGCDIMCVNLVDRTAPGKIIKLARQNNIPIIFFNREPVKEDLMQWNKLYYVGCDAEQSGVMQGHRFSSGGFSVFYHSSGGMADLVFADCLCYCIGSDYRTSHLSEASQDSASGFAGAGDTGLSRRPGGFSDDRSAGKRLAFGRCTGNGTPAF